MLISPDNSIIKNVSLDFPKLSLVFTFLEFVFIGTNIFHPSTYLWFLLL